MNASRLTTYDFNASPLTSRNLRGAVHKSSCTPWPSWIRIQDPTLPMIAYTIKTTVDSLSENIIYSWFVVAKNCPVVPGRRVCGPTVVETVFEDEQTSSGQRSRLQIHPSRHALNWACRLFENKDWQNCDTTCCCKSNPTFAAVVIRAWSSRSRC